jgi:putative oxygen-independent coproporphyrinogen III oxidase
MPETGPEGGFGLYVHWPFCAAKCPYCDFNSHVRTEKPDAMAYAAALVTEMEWVAARMSARPTLNSIFFGGGTPSLMPGAAVALVIDAAARLFPFAPDIEITLEANPTSTDAARFADYASAGVNRASVGIQALNDKDLKALGRWHSVTEARAAFETAQRNFARTSFDLIYAREGQRVADWEAELKEALTLAADHLSLYQLTIEDGTAFGVLAKAGKLTIPDDDAAAEFYAVTQAITGDAGLPHYEISNHAAPGAESRHNLVYWRYGEFIGIGPGAHGRVSLGGALTATATERLPERWLHHVMSRGEGFVTREAVTREAQAEEYLVMALRLAEGLDISRYETLARRPFDETVIAALAGHGLLQKTEGRLKATPQGRMVLNRLVAELA